MVEGLHPQPPNGESPGLYKFDDSLEFHLPGFGSARDSCGEPVYLGHFDDHDVHFVRHLRSCHRFECPVCWKSWRSRAVKDIMKRLGTYIDQTHRRLVHFVVSPPQSVRYDSLSAFRSLRKGAYKIAKTRGIKGGVMIFHQRSIRYANPEEYKRSHCSEGPHFHLVADGWLSNVKELFLGDGWIVKNLRIREVSGIFRTLSYILEHASRGYPAIRQSSCPDVARVDAITWFGTMAYNRLRIPKFAGSDVIYCPICDEGIEKGEWYILEWFDPDHPPPDPGIAKIDPRAGFLVGRPLTMWSGYA
jgi:hypothetical protein